MTDFTAPRVVVVGGGPVGVPVALGLAAAGVRTELVEARSRAGAARHPGNARPIALSLGSRRILGSLGLWNPLAPAAEPVRTVHVSEQGRFGTTRIRAATYGVDALGFVVDAGAIGEANDAALDARGGEGLIVRRPARVASIDTGDGLARLDIDAGEGIPVEARRCELVIIADGAALPDGDREPATRSRLQLALSAVVTPSRDHQGIAYERFTREGPLALLPMRGGRCGLVWACSRALADVLADAPDAGLLERLQAAFGDRLGRFRAVEGRRVHDLDLARARDPIGPRTVRIGNAAQSLHPIAGQGLNLGLRDAAVLVEHLARASRLGGDLGDPDTLRAYLSRRRSDRTLVTGFTDLLARSSTWRAGPVATVRGLGLAALDLAPGAKRSFALHAMGLGPPVSRLARGLAP